MSDTNENVKFTLKADGVPQTAAGADKVSAAFRRLDGQVRGTALSLNSISTAVTRATTAAGLLTGLGGAGVFAFVSSVADSIDSLNDLEDATGSTVEKLSALENIALRNDSSLQAAGDAVLKLQKALSEAGQNPKSGAAQMLRELGLSVDELLQADPVDALQKVAVAFSNVADGGEKGRYLLDLMGKSVRELAPLFKDLASAGTLQGTVTAKQAAEVEKFKKGLAVLRKDALDLSRILAGPLVSALNEVGDAARTNGTGFAPLADGLTKVAATYRLIGLGIDRITPLEILKKDPTNPRALAELKRIDEAAKGIVTSATAANEALRKMAVDRAVARSLADADNPDNMDARDRRLAAKRQLRPLGDDGSASKAAEERRRLAELAARQIVDIEEQAAKDVAEAWGIWEQQQLESSKLRSDAMKEQWRQVFEFIDEQQAEDIAQGQAYLDAVAKTGAEVAEELSLVFSSAAGEAITNWQGVRSLLKGILQDVAQVALKATVTDPLGKAVGGFLGGIDFGSIFKDLVPKFDTGIDYVPRDMLAYIHKGERVVPAAENRSGGGRPVAVTFNLPAGSSPDDWRRSQRQIEASMARAMRRGSAIA